MCKTQTARNLRDLYSSITQKDMPILTIGKPYSCYMETRYTDNTGITHDVRILTRHYNNEMIFTIYQDGNHLCDLERDEDRWIEVYNGPSDRATEYGELIDSLLIFADRTFEKTRVI